MKHLYFAVNALLLGLYITLLGLGVFKKYPHDESAQKKWKDEWGTMLVVCGCISFVMGVLLLF